MEVSPWNSILRSPASKKSTNIETSRKSLKPCSAALLNKIYQSISVKSMKTEDSRWSPKSRWSECTWACSCAEVVVDAFLRRKLAAFASRLLRWCRWTTEKLQWVSRIKAAFYVALPPGRRCVPFTIASSISISQGFVSISLAKERTERITRSKV